MKVPNTETSELDGRLAGVEQWLVERCKLVQGISLTSIDPDLDLVDSGLIDSLRLVEFAFVLGKATGQRPDLREIRLGQFRTLRLIGQYVVSETA